MSKLIKNINKFFKRKRTPAPDGLIVGRLINQNKTFTSLAPFFLDYKRAISPIKVIVGIIVFLLIISSVLAFGVVDEGLFGQRREHSAAQTEDMLVLGVDDAAVGVVEELGSEGGADEVEEVDNEESANNDLKNEKSEDSEILPASSDVNSALELPEKMPFDEVEKVKDVLKPVGEVGKKVDSSLDKKVVEPVGKIVEDVSSEVKNLTDGTQKDLECTKKLLGGGLLKTIECAL